jgi:cell division protein ZapA
MSPFLTDEHTVSDRKKTFVVDILGRQYSIKSDGNENYIKQLMEYINEKTKEVMESTQNVSTLDVAIKTAIRIADDLFQEREEKEMLKRELQEESKRLIHEIQSHLKEDHEVP